MASARSSDAVRADAAAALALGRCLARPATLVTGRLLCVDGPAGSGKTSLAEAVLTLARERLAAVTLLHLDDLYEGWGGLAGVGPRLRDDVVEPLAAGRPGRYRRWDWAGDRWAEEHVVEPVDLLVLEGVGAGALEYADRIGLLVWVEAPRALRLARGIARDGAALRPRWEAWLDAEEAHLARQRTRARADLVVDGTGPVTAP